MKGDDTVSGEENEDSRRDAGKQVKLGDEG